MGIRFFKIIFKIINHNLKAIKLQDEFDISLEMDIEVMEGLPKYFRILYMKHPIFNFNIFSNFKMSRSRRL